MDPSPDSSLTGLPNELLHRIFRLLGDEDVGTARQTCKTLANVGAEYLMSNVYLFLTEQSFNDLETLGQYPLLGPQTRHLNYHADKLRPETMQQYIGRRHPGLAHQRQQIAQQGLRFLRPHLAVQEQALESRQSALEQDWAKRQRIYDQQQHLISSGKDAAILTTLFERCPRLDSVRLSYVECAYSGSSVERRMRKMYGDSEMFPNGDTNPLTAGAADLRILCAALVECNRKLKRFEGRYLGCATILPENLKIDQMQTAFSHLRHLDLKFELDPGDDVYIPNRPPLADDEPHEPNPEIFDHGVQSFRRSQLPVVLKAMPELKTLHLSFPILEMSFPEEVDTVASLSYIIDANTTWPQLRDLKLTGLTVSTDHFVDFLLRHKDRLRKLSLRHLTLMVDGSANWTTVFERIAGNFPRLQKVRLDSQFGVILAGDMERQQQFWFDGGMNYNDPEFYINRKVGQYIIKGGDAPDWEVLMDVDAAMGQWESEEDISEDAGMGYTVEVPPEGIATSEEDELYDSDGSLIEMGDDQDY